MDRRLIAGFGLDVIPSCMAEEDAAGIDTGRASVAATCGAGGVVTSRPESSGVGVISRNPRSVCSESSFAWPRLFSAIVSEVCIFALAREESPKLILRLLRPLKVLFFVF